jgi:hypothetical protein
METRKARKYNAPVPVAPAGYILATEIRKIYNISESALNYYFAKLKKVRVLCGERHYAAFKVTTELNQIINDMLQRRAVAQKNRDRFNASKSKTQKYYTNNQPTYSDYKRESFTSWNQLLADPKCSLSAYLYCSGKSGE